MFVELAKDVHATVALDDVSEFADENTDVRLIHFGQQLAKKHHVLALSLMPIDRVDEIHDCLINRTYAFAGLHVLDVVREFILEILVNDVRD